MPKSTTETLESKIDRALVMLADDFDWDAYFEDGDPFGYDIDVFRSCCELPKADEDLPKLCEVGSRRIEDTPSALYRLLYLMRPNPVDFSDMYKDRLFMILSADRRYAVSVELFKYELALYFYAPKDTVPPKIVESDFDITSDIPGTDNGWRTTDPVATKFFDLVCLAAERTWLVYGGNDFEV